jgi:hypothetical protein
MKMKKNELDKMPADIKDKVKSVLLELSTEIIGRYRI